MVYELFQLYSESGDVCLYWGFKKYDSSVLCYSDGKKYIDK